MTAFPSALDKISEFFWGVGRENYVFLKKKIADFIPKKHLLILTSNSHGSLLDAVE